MKLNNYLVIDCETGGLDRKNQEHARLCPITQIACIGVRLDNFQELGRYVAYIKGQYTKEGYRGYSSELIYQEEALKFTGITIDKIEKEGKDYKEVVKGLIEVFQKTNTGSHFNKPIIVGQNITYDIPFIQYLFELAKQDLSKYVSGWKDHKGTFHPHHMDLMWLSRFKWVDDSLKHNLTTISERLSVDLYDAHGALNDTIATLECVKVLSQQFRNNSQTSNESTITKFRNTFQF